MRILIILSALAVGACGVDGAPERPEPAGIQPGIAISGTAEIGVTGSF